MPSSERFSVERIAELARIDLSHDQVAQAQSELEQILDFVTILEELDLADVQPFFGITPSASLPLRDDDVGESTSLDEILLNAPDHDSQFYRVPPVFE